MKNQHSLAFPMKVIASHAYDPQVSYIVPEFNLWPKWLSEHSKKDRPDDGSQLSLMLRFRPLQDEVRQHLKGKLPAYAVPTIFVPLSKLPLNPNGKVDKPALPFPDVVDLTTITSEEDEVSWKRLSRTEQDVAGLWASLISGVTAKSIKPTDSFYDLGGHSILGRFYS